LEDAKVSKPEEECVDEVAIVVVVVVEKVM
jgi:hypothetical protein